MIACNTASAKALRTVQERLLPEMAPDRRVLGIIRPSVEALASLPPGRTVALWATPGTVTSTSYALELSKVRPDLRLVQVACRCSSRWSRTASSADRVSTTSSSATGARRCGTHRRWTRSSSAARTTRCSPTRSGAWCRPACRSFRKARSSRRASPTTSCATRDRAAPLPRRRGAVPHHRPKRRVRPAGRALPGAARALRAGGDRLAGPGRLVLPDVEPRLRLAETASVPVTRSTSPSPSTSPRRASHASGCRRSIVGARSGRA